MKKTLLICGVILLTAIFNKGISQCTFSNAAVELIGNPYTDPVTGKCMIRFDLYFDLNSNGGGKYIYVHIWPTALYPNLSYSSAPTAANLTNAVITFGVYHHGADLYIVNSYAPDPTISSFQFEGLSVRIGPGAISGYDRFEVEGLLIASSSSCLIPQSFTADAWQTQAANGSVVHCFSKGLVFYANDPKITGLFYCLTPRQYKFDITTINTSGLTVNYNVFIDVDGNGVYNSTIDNININSGTATMDASNNYKFSSGTLGYLPYSGQKAYADLSLWVVVSSASLPNEVYGLITNSCIPLPVKFASFAVRRNNENVELKWVTATETNNKGFYIERKNTDESWEQVGYIATKAYNGNSSEMIQYQYNDYNTQKAVSQYRIAQMDMDGRTSYSDIRMVKGLGQLVKLLVFPNPSADGQINIVMENINALTVIQLLDMNGRLVKSWANISSNKIVADNIKSGIYLLRAWPGDGNEPISVKLFVGK